MRSSDDFAVQPTAKRLERSFYRRDAVTVAKSLLGQRLVHVVDGERLAGLIVETEAYLGIPDKAAHSYNGRRTRRTETMYRDGGTVYVFLNYGLHNMLNIVVAQPEVPQAVLIRAVQPTEGLDRMYAQRPKARGITDLCSGPGKLGSAFGIRLAHDGVDLPTDETLFIEQTRRRRLSESEITTTTRVGVDYAEDWASLPLRFYVAGNPHVSVK